MKLPQLLSHFLYQNKTLALPGIGVFTLDSSVAIPSLEEAEQPQILQGISYEQTLVARADTKLIDFIHKYTGKMKPLAESDLDSYLRLGIQLLNIGKPFHFDGIGSIVKNKQEKYEFIPGEYSTTRLILPGDEKAEMTDKKQKILDEEKKEYAPNQRAAKGLLLAIAIVVGITIIGVAGYNLYKKKMPAAKNTPENEVPLKEDTEAVQQANAKPDSISSSKREVITNTRPAVRNGDTTIYKFVILSTANKYRALKRYNQLLGFDLKVKMDTKDSSFFKVYFPIYTTPKDTLHIKDSLSDYYATKTVIEQ